MRIYHVAFAFDKFGSPAGIMRSTFTMDDDVKISVNVLAEWERLAASHSKITRCVVVSWQQLESADGLVTREDEAQRR